MYRAMAMLALVLCLPAQGIRDGFARHVVEFEQHWGRFLLAYCGCPEEARKANDPSLCSAAQQHIDYRAYAKARKAAIRLFALTEGELRQSRLEAPEKK